MPRSRSAVHRRWHTSGGVSAHRRLAAAGAGVEISPSASIQAQPESVTASTGARGSSTRAVIGASGAGRGKPSSRDDARTPPERQAFAGCSRGQRDSVENLSGEPLFVIFEISRAPPDNQAAIFLNINFSSSERSAALLCFFDHEFGDIFTINNKYRKAFCDIIRGFVFYMKCYSEKSVRNIEGKSDCFNPNFLRIF
ncbi:hypothetical protein KL86APRO_30076 [uncultured Alphaproteobacteria bacterium]|uniref:Uncharacterized protein n=1 Tax=uncultured Alphaproteobacteria bacterium TaxID=91750 RepID=A0A212KLI3_9PROT|nr:hypothetical protein KL86APRO_30076 [uncultured Alphaproteobacteria bacterium]